MNSSFAASADWSSAFWLSIRRTRRTAKIANQATAASPRSAVASSLWNAARSAESATASARRLSRRLPALS
jgi:hypothetical protein